MLLFTVCSLAAPLSAHAGGVPFFGPIIPDEYNRCAANWGLLMVVINNIISLFITIAILFIAPLMVAYSGFLFVVNPVNASGKEEAKKVLQNTVVGIVIALAGWMIVDALMAVLYEPGNASKHWSDLVTGGGASFCIPLKGSLNQGSSSVPTLEVSLVQNIPPAPAPIESVPISKALERLDSEGHEDAIDILDPDYIKMDDTKNGLRQEDPAPPATPENPIGSGTENAVQGIIEKEALPTSSPTSRRINGVDANLVKAIIQAESSGNPDATHLDKDGKSSYGLMQMRPDTAKRFDSNLNGLSDAAIGEKLKDPDYNVKLGTAYLRDLSTKYNGDLDKTIAAYNGGPGANKDSRDCPGSSRWQCQWDNKAQTIPNTGYDVTRNYVTKVNQYYSKLKT